MDGFMNGKIRVTKGNGRSDTPLLMNPINWTRDCINASFGYVSGTTFLSGCSCRMAKIFNLQLYKPEYFPVDFQEINSILQTGNIYNTRTAS